MRVPEDWDTKLLQNTVKCLPISMCHTSEDWNLQQYFLFITVYNGICRYHTPEYTLTVNVWHLTTYRNMCACTCDYITSIHQVYIASKPKYPYGCCLLGWGTMCAGRSARVIYPDDSASKFLSISHAVIPGYMVHMPEDSKLCKHWCDNLKSHNPQTFHPVQLGHTKKKKKNLSPYIYSLVLQ
jgi:hypothetical protein